LASLNYLPKNSPVTGSFKYAENYNPYSYAVQPVDEKGEVVEEPVPGVFYDTVTKGLTESVGASLNFDFPKFPLKLSSRIDYDIFRKEFGHSSVQQGFDYQCVLFRIGYKWINRYGVKDARWDIGISVGNLGTVKNLLGAR